MLLAGMVISSLAFGEILSVFSNVKLIQVIQGAAVITMCLNVLSLWKQEVRDPNRTRPDRRTPAFRESWRAFVRGGNASRLLIAVGLGGAAFSMQDVLLEPYGGQILKMGVGATTSLTAMMAGGGLIAFTLASRYLFHGGSPYRLATYGAITGVIGFASVIFSDPFALNSILLFRLATGMIGFSGGLFSVGTLTAAMELETNGNNGLALGAWGAVQASAAGIGVAAGGAIRDLVSVLAAQGALGHSLTGPSVGYALVYHIEIGLLFATLFVIAPLARSAQENRGQSATQFGLADFPG
jgi:BCD family chlorophyll transporter-like MFS transporter